MPRCYAYTASSQRDTGPRRQGKGIFLIRQLFIITLLAGFVAPIQASAGCRANSSAIFVSPGYQPPPPGSNTTVPWGGYHVQITTFSTNHVCPPGSIIEVARQAWVKVQNGAKPYSFMHKTYSAVNLKHECIKGKCWGIEFDSPTLTNFRNELEKNGFRPASKGAKVPGIPHWQIALYQASAKEAKAFFKNNLQKKPWWPFKVLKPDAQCRIVGDFCPSSDWTPIFPKKQSG